MRTTGRILLMIPVLGLAGLSGCANGQPLMGRTTAMGSLKSSVSQLEYRNDELEREVSSLKAENRRFEDRLVQERTENERLATQLDDAKGRLGEPTDDIRTGSRSSVEDDGPLPPPRAKRTKSSRKPPAAAIPGTIEPARPTDATGEDLGAADAPSGRGRLASRKRYDDRWLPVARGTGAAKVQ